MHLLIKIWNQLEKFSLIFSLAAMVIITFLYVLANNLYALFFAFSDYFETSWPLGANFCSYIGAGIMVLAQEMTWSNAIVKIFFTALIFLGAAYGVKTAGHIGIDAVVKLFAPQTKRKISIVAVLCSILYVILILISAISVWNTAFIANVYGDDLNQFGIKTWHIISIMLLGFILILIRFLEVLWYLITGQQTDLGLADEVKQATHRQNKG